MALVMVGDPDAAPADVDQIADGARWAFSP
jgi:hypothetical protein